MYIRESTHIQLPVALCAIALPDAALDAAGEQASVGFKLGPARLRKRVALVVGEPEHEGDWVRIPVRWSAQPAEGWFPVLDGYLRLEPLGPSESKLSLRALYQPPLGRIGQAIDDAALHAVARLTVKDFVNAVRARVLEAAPAAVSKEV